MSSCVQKVTKIVPNCLRFQLGKAMYSLRNRFAILLVFKQLGLILLLAGLLFTLTSCKQGRTGSTGPKGESGKMQMTEELSAPVAEGTSSGGGGGFLHKNSKRLFSDTQEKLIEILKNSSPDVYKSLGGNWNKNKVVQIIKNIEIAPDANVIRNGDDVLLYDYGYSSIDGTPWLKVLKPFFDYYSVVPVKGPKGRHYYEVQTQIVIELFHELAHLVLNHPKGEVSKKEVLLIESQAEKFAENLFTTLVSEALVCSGEMNYKLFGIEPPSEEELSEEDGEEEGEMDEPIVAPEESLVWVLLNHSDRGVVLKLEDPSIAASFLDEASQADFEMNNLTYFRESVGVLNRNGEGVVFPPAPRFDTFFNSLSENEIVWNTAIYGVVQTENEMRVRIGRYKQGFEAGLPLAGGGLIQRFAKLEDVIWGAHSNVDYKKSHHEIIVPKASGGEALYEYENVKKGIYDDPREGFEGGEEPNIETIGLECQPFVRKFDLPNVWSDR